MTQRKQLQFRPYARLLTMLGDQLIKNERIALIELIKNSYDADASWVKITFANFGKEFEAWPESSIIIEDDGVGMTEEILSEHWVNPATPIKKLQKNTKPATAKGRKIQGEKGIGRFAILKLGRTTQIETRPKGSSTEYTLELDLSAFDDDFRKLGSKEAPQFLDQLDLDLRSSDSPSVIRSRPIRLGSRRINRSPHGTRIEVSNLRGNWTTEKVKGVYKDLVRLQSIFNEMDLGKEGKQSEPDFEVAIYRDNEYENFSSQYLEKLRNLMREHSAIRITNGEYDGNAQEFRFLLNGKKTALALSDEEVVGLSLFRKWFGKNGELLRRRQTACGSFSFGFYVFDFSAKPNSKFYLDKEDRDVIKDHRIYLYRDNVRVYPYGDPDDDWLQIDAYRGTISAGQFLSNDQVVGYVNITQKGNPHLVDKTNREGLIDSGNATQDFIHLLQILLAWVRKKPYAHYRAKVASKTGLDAFKQDEINRALDDLEEKLSQGKSTQSIQESLAATRRLYKAERSYLIQRAETTEHLAGVGLSVETASHDIMAVMGRALIVLDSLIGETQRRGNLNRELISRDLNTVRGMLSFVEAQLTNIQLLFKSSKQKRKNVRVREILEKVHNLFKSSLARAHISFEMVEKGSPLVAKTTDAVLLQVFLNLFDNAVYWLETKSSGKRAIEVTLDGDEGTLIFSDSGPGIKSDDVPFLFEPFYSGKGEEGRGLGLYIARQLLERHEYSIDLADLKKHRILPGANFVITFVGGEN